MLSAGERQVGASTGAGWAAAQGPGTHCCGAVSGLPSCSHAAGPGPGDSMTLSLFLLKEAPEARSKEPDLPPNLWREGCSASTCFLGLLQQVMTNWVT